jgi:hypothetical protein
MHTKLNTMVTLGESSFLYSSFISSLGYFYNNHIFKLLYNFLKVFHLLAFEKPPISLKIHNFPCDNFSDLVQTFSNVILPPQAPWPQNQLGR